MSQDEPEFLEGASPSERVRSYREQLSRERGRSVSLDEAVRHWIQEQARRWLEDETPDPSEKDD